MKLVTSGCSYTYGDAQDQKWDTYSWPFHLSNKLNIEHLGLEWSGFSNNEICNRIIKNSYLYDKDDYFVIQLTWFGRVPKYTIRMKPDEKIYSMLPRENKDFGYAIDYYNTLMSVINLITFFNVYNYKYLIIPAVDSLKLKKINGVWNFIPLDFQEQNFKNNIFTLEGIPCDHYKDLSEISYVGGTTVCTIPQTSCYIPYSLVDYVVSNENYIDISMLKYLAEKGLELYNDNTYFFHKTKGKVDNHFNSQGAELLADRILEEIN